MFAIVHRQHSIVDGASTFIYNNNCTKALKTEFLFFGGGGEGGILGCPSPLHFTGKGGGHHTCPQSTLTSRAVKTGSRHLSVASSDTG